MQKRIFISVLGGIYDDKCCINEMTFRELCETLKTSQVLKQTEEEYNALPDDEKRQLKFGACFCACVRNEQGDKPEDLAYILALDVDHPNATLLDDIKTTYPDTKVFAYTTFRSREDSPRYRIIIPLSRPVSKDEYAKLCEAFTEMLNCEFDKQCFNFRQKLQFPRVLKGVEYHFWEWGHSACAVDSPSVTLDPCSRPSSEYAKLSCRGDKVSDAKIVGREIGCSVTLPDCDKSYIESFYGLLKIDLLSLRTLDAVSNMLANIEKNENIRINFSEIPEEKEVYSSVFHNGNTDFIF